jgi:hypothetical protein
MERGSDTSISPLSRRQDAPQLAGAGVAERRFPPTRQNGGNEGAQARELRVADRVDAGVYGVEAAGGEAVSDRRLAEPERAQLLARDHHVLVPREPPGRPGNRLLDFGCHSHQKSAID